MKLLSAIALLLGIACLVQWTTAASIRNAEKVHMEFFVETLCPYCQTFLKQQLQPNLELLSAIADFNLTSYGGVLETPTADGGYTFQCQHGTEECEGNMRIACTKHHVRKDLLKFTICYEKYISNSDSDGIVKKCASELNWAEDTTAAVVQCAHSVEGQKLFHAEGVYQNQQDPQPTYVPWIVYNGIHTEEIQDFAQDDLKGFVCSMYQGPKPEFCSSTKTLFSNEI